MVNGRPKPLNQAEYMALAEFRYQIRKFLRFMEEKAREAGQNPQQYQLILALKGLPAGTGPSIGALAERMQLNHNSTVELVDRCEKRGLVRRLRSRGDRRQVDLVITPQGDAFLRTLASAGREELRTVGPILAEHIQRLISQDRPASRSGLSGEGRTRGKRKAAL
jgi:DNA-binding MarR family transcriptional regulator